MGPTRIRSDVGRDLIVVALIFVWPLAKQMFPGRIKLFKPKLLYLGYFLMNFAEIRGQSV